MFYKSFDANMTCSADWANTTPLTYKVGYITSKIGGRIGETLNLENPPSQLVETAYKPSSSELLHFSDSVVRASEYYTSILCVVAPVGEYWKVGTKKFGTRRLSVLKVLTPQEVKEITLQEKINIVVLSEFVKANPLAIIGGSYALFLQGYNMPSDWPRNTSDFDTFLPYYTPILTVGGEESECEMDNMSGNDFDYTTTFAANDCYVKIDVRVDPKVRWRTVGYKGKKYKVANAMDILAAKVKYAQMGNQKHISDLTEMMSAPKHNETGENTHDLPF